MPSRMIRGDDLLESERYTSLPPENQVFYIHCLLSADDFGLLMLTPLTIGRRFWMRRRSDGYITKRIRAVEDRDLIRSFECDGVLFGFLPRFRQRLKNFRCKHPMPAPALYQDDADAVENFTKYRNIFKKHAPSSRRALPSHGESRPEVEVEVEVERNTKRREVEGEVPLAGAAPSATDADAKPLFSIPERQSQPQNPGIDGRAGTTYGLIDDILN